MLSSSIQATLLGRFAGSEYGKSKLAGEELFFDYGKETGAKVLVYRFPNLFGKWCRPNYNSAVATFCHNMANGLPIQVNDRSTMLELLYIDDLVAEMLDALEGKEHRCEFDGMTAVEQKSGRYCFVPVTHKATLGEIVDLLEEFVRQPQTLVMPQNRYTYSLSFLSSTGESCLFTEDERGRAGKFHGAFENKGLRTVFCQHQQAGGDQGTALASHQMGVFYCGVRPRPDPAAESGRG